MSTVLAADPTTGEIDMTPEERVDAMTQVAPLLKRRTALALMTDIPDMAKYVAEWEWLGKQFSSLGYKYNAAICASNAARYAKRVKAEQPAVDHPVRITLDEATTIEFPSVDSFSGWLAEVMANGQ